MTWEVFDAWSQRSVRGFADQQVAAGLASPPAALAYARRQLAAQLPDGLATPTHLLWTVHVTEDPAGDLPSGPVGQLWLRVRPLASGVEATVLDVDVDVALRGRGLGRATMLAAQDAAADLGATVLRLTVFGHNTAALALYSGLGLTVERALLSRNVSAAVRPEGSAHPRLRLAAMTEPDRARLRRATGRAPAARLPGTEQPEHRLWTAWDGAAQVGRLWLQLDDRAALDDDGERRVSVHHLEVAPELRGRGYGRALVSAAEAASRELRAVAMTVTLAGPDAVSQPAGTRAFCERMGFVLTARLMARPLAGTPRGPRPASGWPSA